MFTNIQIQRGIWFIGGVVVSTSMYFALVAFAWTGPVASPPNNNATAPLNVSSAGQVKSGGLELNTGGATNGLIVNGKLCLNGYSGSKCINDWVQAVGQWTTSGNDIYNNNLGYVSIGTTTPLRPLFIQTAIPGGMVGYLNTNPNGFTSFDLFNESSVLALSFGHGNSGTGSQFANLNYINGNNYSPISFQQNNIEVMRVHSNLNVGIGTSSPFQKLSVVGNAYINGTLTVTGVVTGAAFNPSDERLKKNIEAIASSTALAKVMALQPVTYNWIDTSKPTTTQIGFIAQQVQKIIPEIVYTDPNTTLEAVDYARITTILVGAVQSQQEQIKELSAEVAALKASR
jgi:hypothetical protein